MEENTIIYIIAFVAYFCVVFCRLRRNRLRHRDNVTGFLVLLCPCFFRNRQQQQQEEEEEDRLRRIRQRDEYANPSRSSYYNGLITNTNGEDLMQQRRNYIMDNIVVTVSHLFGCHTCCTVHYITVM